MLRLAPLPRRVFAAVPLVVLALLATAFAIPTAGAGPTDPVDHSGGATILVTFRRSAGAAEVKAAHASTRARTVRDIKAIRTQAVRVDDASAALATYRARPDVEWAGFDGEVHARNA